VSSSPNRARGIGVVERFADDVAVGGDLALEGGRDERKCSLG
jgi:hypothetical protein